MSNESATIYEGDRVNLPSAVPLRSPLLVHLETTNRCNFKCKFCPESLDSYIDEAGGLFLLSEADFQRIIDQLAELGAPKMLNFFVMGEPLMNKNLNNYVRYARSKLPHTVLVVSTNGALLTEEKFQGICESGLDFLRVSIFGHDEETHRENTQKKIPLAKIKKNIQDFANYRDSLGHEKPFIYAKAIRSPVEEHNLAFIDMFKDAGDKVVLEGLSNWNDTDGKFSSTYGVDQMELLESDYFKHAKEVCPYPFYSLVIHSDMNVSVCCIDWNKKTNVGNLGTQSLQEIWEGDALLDFQVTHLLRKKNDIGACRNCTYFYTLRDNLDDLSVDEYLGRVSERKRDQQ